MFVKQPEIQGMSIVLLGDFNPKIFQPAWFAAEKLIRVPEAESAEIEIIHPEIIIFKLEWVNIQITRDSCSFSTIQEPYYEIMRDLCIGTFRLLRHTPIRKLGINRDVHFRMKSTEEWHSLGHSLAPKELWGKVLQNPGLISLTINGERIDGLKGYIKVKVEPSSKVEIGVYIQVNDHYEAVETAIGGDEIINVLESSWERSKTNSIAIINAVLEWK